MADVDIKYNTFDFFYVKVGDKTPSVDQCKDNYKKIPDSKCGHFPTISDVFLDEIENCRNLQGTANIHECLAGVDHANMDRTTYADDYDNWIIWQDNSYNCYKRELCRNRDLANEIKQIQKDHLGSEQNLNNSKLSYNNELMKTGNLTIGIIGLMILIYYTR